MRSAAEYILPLKWTDKGPLVELARYLRELTQWIDVTVVDGSADPFFDRHACAFPPEVRHLRVDPDLVREGGNGKVQGVMTGLRMARHELVVIADDDVRYRRSELEHLLVLLDGADLVRPQNYFSSLPWHARWDTGRILLNRAFGSDYPGTLGIRRSTVLAAGGYSVEALFENLELIRTVHAVNGVEVCADDLFVARTPCSWRHFAKQRVRQAYDSFAQPFRLVAELSLLPAVLLVRPSPRHITGMSLVAIALAEVGRRRRNGRLAFGRSGVLWAPVWLLERAVCSWLAVMSRAQGGVRYAGGRLPLAAHSEHQLRSALAHRRTPGSTDSRHQLSQRRRGGRTTAVMLRQW